MGAPLCGGRVRLCWPIERNARSFHACGTAQSAAQDTFLTSCHDRHQRRRVAGRRRARRSAQSQPWRRTSGTVIPSTYGHGAAPSPRGLCATPGITLSSRELSMRTCVAFGRGLARARSFLSGNPIQGTTMDHACGAATRKEWSVVSQGAPDSLSNL